MAGGGHVDASSSAERRQCIQKMTEKKTMPKARTMTCSRKSSQKKTSHSSKEGAREKTRPAGEYVALKNAQEKETEGSWRVSKEDDMVAIGEVFVGLDGDVALLCMSLIVRDVVRIFGTYQLEKRIEVIL
jgi:hypothetical protein